jgi:hypothetical protein
MSVARADQARSLAVGLLQGVLAEHAKKPGFPGPLVWAHAMQHVVNTIVASMLQDADLAVFVRAESPWIIEGQPTPTHADCMVTLTFPGNRQ